MYKLILKLSHYSFSKKPIFTYKAKCSSWEKLSEKFASRQIT